MAATSSDSGTPHGRGPRRILVGLVIAAILLLIFIALLPTLISFGLGQGYIRDAIAKNVNGSVDLKDVSVGWFSAQKVDGLRITDSAGKEAANLSITVNNGLLSLALGRARPMAVTVTGSAAGQVREDGSISFADLIKERPPPVRVMPPQPHLKQPFRASDLPSVSVNIAGLDVTLENLKHKQSLALNDLTGTAAYIDPSQPITLKLAGKTSTNVGGSATAGSIDITGQIDRLFAANGALTLRGASATLNVKAAGIPLPLLDRPATVETLSLKIASDDLTERISIESDGRGKVDGIAGDSTFKIDGGLTRIIDDAGKPSLRAAGAHFNIDVTNLPLRAGDISGEVRTFTASIVSDDLTQKLAIAAQGSGVFRPATTGAAPSAAPSPDQSTLTANLSITNPFTPEGRLHLAPENIAGSIEGRNVPASLAEMALARTPIRPARDLGPMLDVEASFPGGVGTGSDIRAFVHAAKASAEVVAQIDDDRSIIGSKLLLNVREASPELLAALTQRHVFSDRPLTVEVNLSSFRWPAVDEATDTRPLTQVAARGTVKVIGPTSVQIAEPVSVGNHQSTDLQHDAQPARANPATIALERIDLTIDTPALGEYLQVNGTVTLGGGRIGVDQRITHLLDANGQLAAMGARPQGAITLENLPAATIVAFAPVEQRDLVHEVLRGGLNGDVVTTFADNGLRAAVNLRSEALALNAIALRHSSGGIALDKTHAEATVTPALLALLQKDIEQPVVLRAPAKVVADLEAFSIPAPDAKTPLFATPLRGRIALSDANIERKPTLAEPLSIPSLTLNLSIAESAGAGANASTTHTITIADGRGSLRRADASRDFATLAFDGSFAQTGTTTTPNLNMRITDLNTREAETLLGQTPGAIANWTGDTGALDAQIESDKAGGYRARLSPNMPNVQGTFIASVRDDMVSITAETSKLVLAKEALQARLNPAPETGSNTSAASGPRPQSEAPQIVVESSVPVQMTITRCEFPKAMIAGEKFDPAKVNVDLKLKGGPLTFAQADGVKSSLSDLDVSLNASDISRGVRFAMKGMAEATVPPPPPEPARPDDRRPAGDTPAGGAQTRPEPQTAEERREARREERRSERVETRPATATTAPASRLPGAQPRRAGVVDVTGTLGNIVTSEGTLDLARARLQMTAKVTEAPTAIADALADMQGLLVAAVGPMMNATFVADDFSANTGTLDARIDTTNGHLEGLLRGRENSFRINKNAPVKAELEITPPLRDRLQMKIHPIHADVRTTEQPLRAEIPTALAAIPADVSKLRAEMNITIGKVEFDAGSTTLQIFSLFGRGDSAVVPGEIEPIRAQIRNGIVTYDKFSVHVGNYTLNYSGQVDLVKRTVDVRTEIPLSALKNDIKELRDYADTIVVPLVTRGTFGNLKTSIDPDFDLGKAALEAGFKGTLGELFKGADGLFKDLFDRPKDK